MSWPGWFQGSRHGSALRADRRLRPNVEGMEARQLMASGQGRAAAAAVAPGIAANPELIQLKNFEVQQLLDRASAATTSQDAIIAIVDRNGRILGVKVEDQVDPNIVNKPDLLTFAIDGAVAKARTGAFFANREAPLTSRTVHALAQTTITQREVESIPSITDENSTVRGPGVVAPIGLNAHFPADVAFTPQVDLFDIEYTNRDTSVNPGSDRVAGNDDDIPIDARFNIDPNFLPDNVIIDGLINAAGEGSIDPNLLNGVTTPAQARALFNSLNQQDRRAVIQAGFIVPPDSYGFQSGVSPRSSPRGIGTLPGGIPIIKGIVEPGRNRVLNLVGGIGVFYPGATGFANEENSRLNDFPEDGVDRTIESEIVGFAAVGGFFHDPRQPISVGALDGVAPVTDTIVDPMTGETFNTSIGLPFGTITLVGLTLDIAGPMGTQGVKRLLDQAEDQNLGLGQGANNGVFQRVLPNGTRFLNGRQVPSGWLVVPHDGVGGLTAADVRLMIEQGRYRAKRTRAAIRLPLDRQAQFIYGITDRDGNVIGLFRDPDATIFSINVAVTKARNANYYADPNKLQPEDQLPGIPRGTAFTARTFRYLAGPRFPHSIDGRPPGPFSKLNDANANFVNGLNKGAPVPASAFTSVEGYDVFHPQTNFRDPTNILNQSGIVFFPGSLPLYKDTNNDGRVELVGGLGISGDGVDQDDVVTIAATKGFRPPNGEILRADQTFFRGVRLPFAHFNRFPRLRVAEDGRPAELR